MRHLRPGVPLRCLHGNMKQLKRMATFYDFCQAPHMVRARSPRRRHVRTFGATPPPPRASCQVMFATDIAARGLDFPSVDWVLQMDCPEDVSAYIHRVGRTARYTAGGRALLLLSPAEAAFVAQLEAARVPITQMRMNPSKTMSVTPALEGLLSKDATLQQQARKAVSSYAKSLHLHSNKAVFDLAKLDVTALARSFGLVAPPRRARALALAPHTHPFRTAERGARAAGCASSRAQPRVRCRSSSSQARRLHRGRGAAPVASRAQEGSATGLPTRARRARRGGRQRRGSGGRGCGCRRRWRRCRRRWSRAAHVGRRQRLGRRGGG